MGSENGLPQIPEGWCWTTGDVVFSFITSGSRGWAQYYADSGVAFLRMGNLNHASITIDLTDIQRVRLPQGVEGTRSRVQKGDILLSITADIGMIGLVPENFEEAYINQHVALARPFPKLNAAFLAWYLAAQYGAQKQFLELQRGATKTGLGLDDIRAIKIPLPPRREQERIVEKIEELFTQLDAGVELLKKLKKKLKRYRQAVLKAAVEGKLTQEWREAHRDTLEPASVLRDRILKERREKWEADQLAQMQAKGKLPKDDSWKKKYKEPTPPKTADLPELPDGWIWVSLEQVSWDCGYGTSEKCDYSFSGYPVLRIPNLVEGKIVLDDLKFALGAKSSNLSNSLATGDLLVIRTNGSRDLIGRAALVTQNYEKPHFFASYLIRFRIVNTEDLPYWVSQIWHYSRIRQWIESAAATSAGQYNVSLTTLNNLALELPPSAEQKRIHEELEQCFSIINQIEKSIEKNLKRAERLRQSILKQAFEGKLVPQDPNDEPASVLCDRIKAEKAKREAEMKAKRKNTVKNRKSNASSPQLEMFQGSVEEPES
ncbi:restriction endonuclease subunit S [Leptolyngbya sp. PL-A3]|uniref:restriction endonuclease subunit S n=1 Tax=Leptolyngbya sp. PL-A3 TaxID=2933911 RepID=UPI003297D20D